MNLSVIIVTLNRPDCLKKGLECLGAQVPRPDQVLVVDASSDDLTEQLVRHFPWVVYVRSQVGYGHMTASRNLGLARATGDIIAFLDDDAFAHPDWLPELLNPYDDPQVGGVGGRALNNQPGEESRGVEEIGRLFPDGRLTGNFAANPGKIIDVDHIIGCNMSFRRSVLSTLGGLREEYPGTEVREETDIALRVRRLGFRLVFNPACVVTHVGAPQVYGRRFDTRYSYFAARNHLVLLIRNYGLSSIFLRHLLGQPFRSLREFVTRLATRRILPAFARLAADFAGTVVGLKQGFLLLLVRGRNPVRHDAAASALRQHLAQQAEELSPNESPL